MFKNQGTSQPEASQEKVNGDIASAWGEEELELDDVQLATVVGGGVVGDLLGNNGIGMGVKLPIIGIKVDADVSVRSSWDLGDGIGIKVDAEV
ncbi:hypothetical protein Q5692_11490 [Microcoleus sp. C2C3]|uniref:hypothetical protein n=1 Tax=unclassified Microcoleus TaxID=2642155 RepID=UPI002FD3BBCF